MKVLLTTSVVSPHMLPVADCLAQRVEVGSFICYASVPSLDWRKDMGWPAPAERSWVHYRSDGDDEVYDRLWAESDVVICTERDFARMEARVKAGRLTFYMSERWLKPPLGMIRLALPRVASAVTQIRRLSQYPSFHYLPIGCLAAADMRRIAAHGRRMWLWGYFLESPPAPLRGVGGGTDRFEVLYAGRLIACKRVIDIVRAFAIVAEAIPHARLKIAGGGRERGRLEAEVSNRGLEGRVSFLGSLRMDEVWRLMESADVLVQASTGREGWGAVINEAMARGCAIVASDASGAASTLLKNGDNALVFRSRHRGQLAECLRLLAADSALRYRLGDAAYRTVSDLWSPRTAAERLLSVSAALLCGQDAPVYSSGPMSCPGGSTIAE